MKAYFIGSLALVAAVAFAAEKDKDTRAGSCDDAKSQYEYFCKGNANDIMMQVPIACNNAKKNMAAACEGVVEPDKKYEFKEEK